MKQKVDVSLTVTFMKSALHVKSLSFMQNNNLKDREECNLLTHGSQYVSLLRYILQENETEVRQETKFFQIPIKRSEETSRDWRLRRRRSGVDVRIRL